MNVDRGRRFGSSNNFGVAPPIVTSERHNGQDEQLLLKKVLP